MMGYFYTLDLGQTCGRKLEALAAQAGFEDVEDFAAMILCHALRAMDDRESGGGHGLVPDRGLDNDIPF